MERVFEGKVALVTGGAFGIGRATAIAFAKRGARVVIGDVTQVDEVVHAIRAEAGRAELVQCDVSNNADVERMVRFTVGHFGRLDYAFNNAGVEGVPAVTHACTDENWDRTLAINLKGIWLCMRHEIPQMLAHGGGAIVNCASIAGLVGFPGLPAYVASKHGVIGLTKTAALENARAGIRINAVCPGAIKTPMLDRFTGKQKEAEKQFADQEPIGRLGAPEEVANAVMWLCSDASSFVTGDALAVDGGWIAR